MNILSFLLCLFVCWNLTAQEVPNRWEFSHPQMGTTFRVVVISPDSVRAAEEVSAVFRWLDSLNQSLSDYLPHSELSELMRRSGSRQLLSVSDQLLEVLQEARAIAEASSGAFDPTIGPLSQVWRRAFRRAEFPEFDRVAEARTRVDFNALVLVPDSQGIRLLMDHMQLDLGGIAKGYAAQQMLDRLMARGFPHVLVDAGGDLAIGFPPPGKPGWAVLPLWPDDNLEPIYVSNTAIATSGDSFQYLEWEGQRYSHIIDPRSGYGVSKQRLVTVQTSSGSQADALASLVNVLGGDAFPIAERIAGDEDLQIWLWENTPKGWILVEFSNM